MNENICDLLEHTSVNVFLTGRAGTGKTSFLRDYVQKTRKNFIITAPTGIASINAGGVTIHSLFKIPPRTFVPTAENTDIGDAINITELLLNFKYDKNRLELLRKLELLIIDEVSMLRADLLDMIDFALRHIRKISSPFGGVQILFIGDLYQLPPVVREDSKQILSNFYDSSFFFSAKALQHTKLLTIELDKVYRQTDLDFLNILDSIRNSDTDKIDFKNLNSRYFPDFEPHEDAYIYLCSHNKQANEINKKKLSELNVKSMFYKASILGNFNISQFPNDEILELKVGSQVMFVKNDISYEKKFYNGKLAKISYLDENNIKVILEDSNEEVNVERYAWEQKKYILGKDKKIHEEIQGRFEQFPIRLAWAITIHKSQGLTFDRMIVDAGDSFTSGQVYVALSRCRTLDGIVLKSKITPKVILRNNRIEKFQEETKSKESLTDILEREKYTCALLKLKTITDVSWLNDTVISWRNKAYSYKIIDSKKVNELTKIILSEIENLIYIFNKFKINIDRKYSDFLADKISWKKIEEKCKGAVNFFYQSVVEKIFIPFSDFHSKTINVKELKTYNKESNDFLNELKIYLENLKNLYLLETSMFAISDDEKIYSKTTKKPSHIITFQMFRDGKTHTQIARERGVTLSTIYGHLAKLAGLGLLELQDLRKSLKSDKVTFFENTYSKVTFDNLTEWKKNLPHDFEFHEIRLLLEFFNFKNKV